MYISAIQHWLMWANKTSPLKSTQFFTNINLDIFFGGRLASPNQGKLLGESQDYTNFKTNMGHGKLGRSELKLDAAAFARAAKPRCLKPCRLGDTLSQGLAVNAAFPWVTFNATRFLRLRA